VSASNGHIPERAVSFSSNSENTIPVYMACVEGTDYDGEIVKIPASMVYEVLDSGQLRYQFARYCNGDKTTDVSEYKILCAK
jgi:hypothetical protein